MNSPKEHKEFIQPTEMAYARWMHGSIASRHVRQSSIKVGNDQQHRWACLDLAAACFFCYRVWRENLVPTQMADRILFNRYEAFVLGPGENKVEVEIDTRRFFLTLLEE